MFIIQHIILYIREMLGDILTFLAIIYFKKIKFGWLECTIFTSCNVK